MRTEGEWKPGSEKPISQLILWWECVYLLMGTLLFLGISGDPREHRQSHTIPNGSTDLLRNKLVSWLDGLGCFYIPDWYVFRDCCSFGKDFQFTCCEPEAQGMIPVFGIHGRDEYVVPIGVWLCSPAYAYGAHVDCSN